MRQFDSVIKAGIKIGLQARSHYAPVHRRDSRLLLLVVASAMFFWGVFGACLWLVF